MTQRNTAHVNGFIRAVANQRHPFQTEVTLILTDFLPNRNKQGIPKAEAENILLTAPHAPIKINFDGEMIGGHDGATPIGSITNAALAEDQGNEVIVGKAIIWNDIFTDVSDHLKQAFAEGIGTSWEIYFEDSHSDDEGVQWLEGCVFGGTCVVDKPAYGSNRTRFLAIAEQLDNDDANNKRLNTTMANDQTVDLREDISGVLDVLSNMYEGLYKMLDTTYELEKTLAVTDMPAMAEQLTKLVTGIQNRFDALVEKATAGDIAIAELTQLKNNIATAEAQKLEQEKKDLRTQALAELGIEVSEQDIGFYVGMDDTVFDRYVNDLKVVKSLQKADATIKDPIIPNVVNTGDNLPSPSIQEIAAYIRGN